MKKLILLLMVLLFALGGCGAEDDTLDTDVLDGGLTGSEELLLIPLDASYENVMPMTNGNICLFSQNGKYGFLNEFGQVLTPAKYVSINSLNQDGSIIINNKRLNTCKFWY